MHFMHYPASLHLQPSVIALLATSTSLTRPSKGLESTLQARHPDLKVQALVNYWYLLLLYYTLYIQDIGIIL